MTEIVKRLYETPLYYGSGEASALGEEAADEIERLTEEVERMRAALKFYADKSNWTNLFGCPPAIHDHGNKARAALTAQETTDV